MNKALERKWGIIFGITFVVVLLLIAFAFPTPTPFQYWVFRVVLSLAASGTAAMIPGFIEVTVEDWVRAGGALAVFVIVYFCSPAALPKPEGEPQKSADVVPTSKQSSIVDSPAAKALESKYGTFADATSRLFQAISAGEAAVQAKRSTSVKLRSMHSKEKDAWERRTVSASAFVDYTNSVVNILDLGETGPDTSRRLYDAASTLSKSLEAGGMGFSAAAGLATDSYAFGYGQLSKALAAESVESTLAELQPMIKRLADLFTADWASLNETMVISFRAERDALDDDNQGALGYYRQLKSAQRELMGEIRTKLLDHPKDPLVTENEQLKRNSEMLDDQEKWYSSYAKEQELVLRKDRAVGEIIASIQSAIGAWRNVHLRLVVYPISKRGVNSTELENATKRIEELLQEYRKL